MKSINGIITDYSLGVGDYNTPTFSLTIEMGSGMVNALGHVCLMRDDPYSNYIGNNGYTGYFLSKVMEVVGVTNLKNVIGKPIRAVFEKDGRLGDSCIGIQHFTQDGITFIPKLVKNELDPAYFGLEDIMDEVDFQIFCSNPHFYCIAQNTHKKSDRYDPVN